MIDDRIVFECGFVCFVVHELNKIEVIKLTIEVQLNIQSRNSISHLTKLSDDKILKTY